MKKILIATDGSASSTEAVEFGVELAAEHEARVIFVHVAPPFDVIPVPGFGMGAGAPRVPHELDRFDRVALDEGENIARTRGSRRAASFSSGTPSTRSLPTPTRRAST